MTVNVLIVFLFTAFFTLVAAQNNQESVNCSDISSSSDFPGDIFTDYQRLHGAIVVHIVITLYCFIIIAFVCNDYFLPSVDCICQDLNLSKEVAGATFMALATSAPELFVNIIGTFVTESDLGVGTVVGSAVFNTLGVPACGGLAAITLIQLDIYALIRDGSIYIVVVAVLTIILWDSRVYWYETMVLLILYVVYFIFMFCEKNISFLTQRNSSRNMSLVSNESITSHTNSNIGDGIYKPFYYHGERIGIEHSVTPNSQNVSEKSEKEDVKIESPASTTDEYSNNLCSIPKGVLRRCWWVFQLPVSTVLWLSVPDCRFKRKFYPLTFIMCVVWIGISSYLVSWMMSIFGETYGITDSVMGITFIAIGGSMPEASSSVINARLGIGSMSISNALGGNTLDILLCLGMPWMVRVLLRGPIIIQSSTIAYNNAFQIAGVLVLFLTAFLNKFKYNRTLGFVCLVLYLLFIAFVVIVSLDIFNIIPNVPCT